MEEGSVLTVLGAPGKNGRHTAKPREFDWEEDSGKFVLLLFQEGKMHRLDSCPTQDEAGKERLQQKFLELREALAEKQKGCTLPWGQQTHVAYEWFPPVKKNPPPCR